MLTIFYFFLSFLLLFSFFSIVFWSLRNGITPSSTSPKQLKAIFSSFDSILDQSLDGSIIDLGSGFGIVVILLAKKYPHVQIIAYETSFIPYCVSKCLSILFRTKNLKIQRKDFLNENLNEASIILCYLSPKIMDKLEIKFKNELKSGIFIISNTFRIKNMKPIKTLTVKDLYNTEIYLYKS